MAQDAGIPVVTLTRALLRHWLVITICVVLGAGAGYGASLLITPTYTATATQLVKGIPGETVSANYQSAQYAVSRAKSYPAFIYSLTVISGVRSDMGSTQSDREVRDDLSATNPIDTPLVVISAKGRTAEEARDKANSAARHLARFITQIEMVNGKSPVIVETAVQAGVPRRPTSPRPVLFTALGTVGGFALGSLIALILAFRTPRPRRSQRSRAAAGLSEDADPHRNEGDADSVAPADYEPAGDAGGAGQRADPERQDTNADLLGADRREDDNEPQRL